MNTWIQMPPTSPGLYIARAVDDRRHLRSPRLISRGPYVRFWTGTHWSAPAAVADLHLPGHLPDATWSVARDEAGRVRHVEWLEAPTVVLHCEDRAA